MNNYAKKLDQKCNASDCQIVKIVDNLAYTISHLVRFDRPEGLNTQTNIKELKAELMTYSKREVLKIAKRYNVSSMIRRPLPTDRKLDDLGLAGIMRLSQLPQLPKIGKIDKKWIYTNICNPMQKKMEELANIQFIDSFNIFDKYINMTYRKFYDHLSIALCSSLREMFCPDCYRSPLNFDFTVEGTLSAIATYRKELKQSISWAFGATYDRTIEAYKPIKNKAICSSLREISYVIEKLDCLLQQDEKTKFNYWNMVPVVGEEIPVIIAGEPCKIKVYASSFHLIVTKDLFNQIKNLVSENI